MRLFGLKSWAAAAAILVGFNATPSFAAATASPGPNEASTQPVAGRTAASAEPAGRWLAEDIRGGGVMDYLQTVLVIAPNGKVSGSGGCNSMGGSATIRGDGIRFSRIASTMKACTPAAMNQERKFFDALKEVRFWRVDGPRQELILRDRRGRPILVLSKM